MLHAETCVALKGWFTTEMLEMIRIFKQSIHNYYYVPENSVLP